MMLREYQSIRIKSFSGWVIGLLSPILIAVALFIYSPGDNLWVILMNPFMLFILFLLLVSGFVYFSWNWMDRSIWKMVWCWRFGLPLIGIIQEDNVQSSYTMDDPKAWSKAFEGNLYQKVDNLHVKRISHKFAVIINPYYEIYPEENSIVRRTFGRIEDYVYNGGIFVSVGGFPFFWAYDLISNDKVPIAKQHEAFLGTLNPDKTIILRKMPIRDRLELKEGTILYEKFNLETTWGDPEEVELFQHDDDKELTGNLLLENDNKLVLQFRSLIRPFHGVLPILRAQSKNHGVISPLAALPYGRGFFILGGMNLTLSGNKKKLSHNAFELSCRAVKNIIMNIRNGTIEAHDESGFSERY